MLWSLQANGVVSWQVMESVGKWCCLLAGGVVCRQVVEIVGKCRYLWASAVICGQVVLSVGKWWSLQASGVNRGQVVKFGGKWCCLWARNEEGGCVGGYWPRCGFWRLVARMGALWSNQSTSGRVVWQVEEMVAHWLTSWFIDKDSVQVVEKAAKWWSFVVKWWTSWQCSEDGIGGQKEQGKAMLVTSRMCKSCWEEEEDKKRQITEREKEMRQKLCYQSEERFHKRKSVKKNQEN